MGKAAVKCLQQLSFFAKVQKALQADKNFRKCQNMNMEVVMTKHETREYAFLLLYEAMVRAEELTTIEDLYASTEEMLELPVPEKVKQYVSGVMSQTEELDNIISEYSKTAEPEPCAGGEPFDSAAGTVHELKNLPQTPVNVVISEAVHLSQAYAYCRRYRLYQRRTGCLCPFEAGGKGGRLPMAQILGIDTSNYTTSAALLDLETGEVHQEKQLLPVKAGEAGLRQSDAVFHHTRQLPELLERLRPFAGGKSGLRCQRFHPSPQCGRLLYALFSHRRRHSPCRCRSYRRTPV